MVNKALADWISTASYEQLLHKQRFAPLGDPIFCDPDLYMLFQERMKATYTTQEDHVAASKRIGW